MQRATQPNRLAALALARRQQGKANNMANKANKAQGKATAAKAQPATATATATATAPAAQAQPQQTHQQIVMQYFGGLPLHANNVKRPQRFGSAMVIWHATMIQYNNGEGTMPTIDEMREWGNSNGLNPTQVQIEFYRCRNYCGVRGRATAVPATIKPLAAVTGASN